MMDVLLVSAHTSETVTFAGEELRRYLERMLRREAGTVSVSLDLEPRTGNDSYRVDMAPAGGTITGSNARSVLLGVYDYLHHLGCRFLTPMKETEVVPEITAEQLTARYEKTASFRHRGVCIEGANSAENVLDFIDWLPKVGFNSFFLQFRVPYPFLARWYHHMENPLRPPEPYSPADAQRDTARFERELKKRSLLLHKVGHGWTAEVLGSSAEGGWNAVEGDVAAQKLDMTALVGGKRGFFQGVPTNTSLCFSNPRTTDVFAEQVVAYARQNPHVDCLHVWLADGYNNICECENCRKTTIADQYIGLLNEIDRRLTAGGLDTRIVFLLYQELLWPPIAAKLHNPDRFLLMFAPITRTFERSYDLSEAGDSIPPYIRNRITLPTSLGENLAFLKAWQERYEGEGFVYDYPLGRAHYGDFGYLHIARIIGQDVKKLRQLGLNGYLSCQELRACSPNMLPNYVMGGVLFDVGLDVEERIAEYFEAAYPGCPGLARDYLEQLSALSSCDYLNGKGPRENPDMAARMANIAGLCEQMEKKLAAAPDAPHWKALRHHSTYIRHLSRAMEALAAGNREESLRRHQALRLFLCQTEPEFQGWLDVFRLLDVTWNYTGFRSD